MAATIVLEKFVVWIAILHKKDMENACFGSKDNDLTVSCERLLYDVPVRSYKMRNL